MLDEEVYEAIEDNQSITENYFGISLLKFFILLLIVLSIGVYVGIILYGTNSVEVLFGLQEYENYLQHEIVQLKNENAQLQKEYFELKEISAQ